MFSETGWYDMMGKKVFVQRLLNELHWWTLEDGWNKLSEYQLNTLKLVKSIVKHD